MTDTRPNINITTQQSLTPPPATATLKDTRTVKTIGDLWQPNLIAPTHILNFSRFRAICTPAFVNGLQWSFYHRLGKVATGTTYAELLLFYRYVASLLKQKDGYIDFITAADILDLKKSNKKSFSDLRGVLRIWLKNGYYGLESEISVVLDRRNKYKYNSTRVESVATLCPKRGPLLEWEEYLFKQAIKSLYSERKITLQHYLICWLTLVFGARPIQWSQTKISSLVVKQSGGEKNYGIFICWAKQHKKKAPVYFPLSRPLGRMLLEQVERVRVRFPKESLPDSMTWDDLPLFPQFTNDQKIKNHLPRTASSITKVIINVGKKANIPNQRNDGRNGPIRINAGRLRHTVGTRLATKGEHGAREIADYLLQTDINSPMTYIDLREWLLKNFDNYWNVRLRACAQVALGIMTTEEARAIVGPLITFSEDGLARKGVGKCGKVGCNARAPLACYGCSKFRPLLEAPHSEFLKTLLAARDRQLDVAPKHINIYDTAIQCVRLVIEACEQRKNEGNENG